MATPPSASPTLSVVVPMFNEEDALPLFARRLRPVLDDLGCSYEVVCVDDGSRDGTARVLRGIRAMWPELRLVRLRRNAGHQRSEERRVGKECRSRWAAER